jgi:hypothetical protein
MTWRDKYKVHPAADVFPMMSDEELEALGQDILENGLLRAHQNHACPQGEANRRERIQSAEKCSSMAAIAWRRWSASASTSTVVR